MPSARIILADGIFFCQKFVYSHYYLYLCTVKLLTNQIMKHLFLTLLCLLLCSSALQAKQPDRYVVVVSMDGFRWDYSLMYRTPFLDSIGSAGVYSRMRPSYPSKTFPNHYTLATGLVPDHHGIIANHFTDRKTGRYFSLKNPETKYDGYFYGGEPIWITAQKQGVKSGIVYWPGSDVEIKGRRPNIWHDYEHNLLPFDERIVEVERILSLPEKQRPHLVMCYFSEPDGIGHDKGPSHPRTRAKVEYMDRLMHHLYHTLMSLPIADKIDFIVTSDHGMTRTSPEMFIRMADYLKPEWISYQQYSVPSFLDGATPACVDSIYDALKSVPHMRVYRRGEFPAHMQFGTNPNIGDITIDCDLGWTTAWDKYEESTGAHGFDPYYSDMQVTLRAIGPSFKEGYAKADIFQNIALYPLICHLLGIKPAQVDGRFEDIADILK